MQNKSLLHLTASDLMTWNVLVLPQETPLREAGRLLLEHQIGGAPVVDAQGRCVGVLSATDFVRFSQKRNDNGNGAPSAGFALPITCSFQRKLRLPRGQEVSQCLLESGRCPLQRRQAGPGGEEMMVCSQPHCVLVDWQIVEVEKLPTDQVSRYMTSTPVTVRPNTPIRELARLMLDMHIHRLIVLDEQRRPIGIVSGTDVLAAVAFTDAWGGPGASETQASAPPGVVAAPKSSS
jgi:CBS domain-containing protein